MDVCANCKPTERLPDGYEEMSAYAKIQQLKHVIKKLEAEQEVRQKVGNIAGAKAVGHELGETRAVLKTIEDAYTEEDREFENMAIESQIEDRENELIAVKGELAELMFNEKDMRSPGSGAVEDDFRALEAKMLNCHLRVGRLAEEIKTLASELM